MCRSIRFKYTTDSKFRNVVPVYTFELDPELLSDPRKSPENLCFCKDPGTNGENCLKAGVLDTSTCNSGKIMSTSIT